MQANNTVEVQDRIAVLTETELYFWACFHAKSTMANKRFANRAHFIGAKVEASLNFAANET